jgi:hypothetical protein
MEDLVRAGSKDRAEPVEGQDREVRPLKWTRSSYALLSAFLAILGLIMIVWWPLVVDYVSTYNPEVPFWRQMDWLLLGIFVGMSALIMAGADLKADAWIVLVGLAGGLTIESWGTQTHLWTYFTFERPPLWIIPAWPTASLAIERLVRLLQRVKLPVPPTGLRWIYRVVFAGFYILMVAFVRPTLDKPFTWLALLAVALLILSPGDRRMALLWFAAGAGLGYFLEVWGTTRQCWTYYTGETPPFFAVLAHGLAAFAFWRGGALVKPLLVKFAPRSPEKLSNQLVHRG